MKYLSGKKLMAPLGLERLVTVISVVYTGTRHTRARRPRNTYARVRDRPAVRGGRSVFTERIRISVLPFVERPERLGSGQLGIAELRVRRRGTVFVVDGLG